MVPPAYTFSLYELGELTNQMASLILLTLQVGSSEKNRLSDAATFSPFTDTACLAASVPVQRCRPMRDSLVSGTALDSLMRLFSWLLSFSTSFLLDDFSPICTSEAAPEPLALPCTTTLPPSVARVARPLEETSMPPPLPPAVLLSVTEQLMMVAVVLSTNKPPPLDFEESRLLWLISTLRSVKGALVYMPPPLVSLSVEVTAL